MPEMPSRLKHRKVQRGKMKGSATAGDNLAFGQYGLQALGTSWVKAIQIEACRVSINRHLNRKGKVWVRIFPDKPITKKPAETRMGKGKGAPEDWVAPVKEGRILYEMEGVELPVAQKALTLASHKIGLKTKILIRESNYREAK